MRMSHIACLTVVTMLLVVPTCFGTIISSGDSISYATASASSSNPDDYDIDSGSYSIITTEAGNFDWSFRLSVETVASVGPGIAGNSGAAAVATASVSGVGSGSAACGSARYSYGSDFGSDSNSNSGTDDYIGPYSGLSFSHKAKATARWDTTDTGVTTAAGASASVSGSIR
jgi:hypothetical protein